MRTKLASAILSSIIAELATDCAHARTEFLTYVQKISIDMTLNNLYPPQCTQIYEGGSLYNSKE